jgi:Zn-finger nucleic acid-binding protein
MSVKQGVEIDYCPQCRGIWLDRGELNKIIELVASDIQDVFHSPSNKLSNNQQTDSSQPFNKKHWLNEIDIIQDKLLLRSFTYICDP